MSTLIGLTAQSVLQEKASGDASPFLTISADSTVEAAVKLLAENKILSAPVVDGEAILGILDMFDVLQFIVHLYSRQQTQSQTPEGFVGWVTSTWEQRATLYFSENVRSILGIATTDKSLNMNFSSDTLLSQIVHEFAKGHHRAMVFNQEKQPVGVISQTDVIKTLYKHLSEEPLANLKNKKMVELGLGKTGAISISPKATALQGFYLMNYYHISAVGVVDELQRPLANLSISDLKGLHSENFESLLLPVLDYLEVFSPNTKRPPISCTPNSTVEEVLKLIIENGVHRIWNIAADQLYGIISLTDLLVALEGAFRV